LIGAAAAAPEPMTSAAAAAIRARLTDGRLTGMRRSGTQVQVSADARRRDTPVVVVSRTPVSAPARLRLEILRDRADDPVGHLRLAHEQVRELDLFYVVLQVG